MPRDFPSLRIAPKRNDNCRTICFQPSGFAARLPATHQQDSPPRRNEPAHPSAESESNSAMQPSEKNGSNRAAAEAGEGSSAVPLADPSRYVNAQKNGRLVPLRRTLLSFASLGS